MDVWLKKKKHLIGRQEEDGTPNWVLSRRRKKPFDQVPSFSLSFSSRWHRSARKAPYALRPVYQQSPQGCPRNRTNICLAEHRSFSTLEREMSAASFLHYPFLQAINAVMLCLSMLRKFLKPLSTSALPSCTPDVISRVPSRTRNVTQGAPGLLSSSTCFAVMLRDNGTSHSGCCHVHAAWITDMRQCTRCK